MILSWVGNLNQFCAASSGSPRRHGHSDGHGSHDRGDGHGNGGSCGDGPRACNGGTRGPSSRGDGAPCGSCMARGYGTCKIDIVLSIMGSIHDLTIYFLIRNVPGFLTKNPLSLA